MNIEETLMQIHQTLEQLNKVVGVTDQEKQDMVAGWTRKKKNKSIFYEITKVYAAPGPVTISLPLDTTGQINYIDQIWNTAGAPSSNAKDISVRFFSNIIAINYIKLQDLSGNTSDSEILNLDRKFSFGAKLDFVYENYTDADTVKINVQVDEI